jgi:hypothetical protein
VFEILSVKKKKLTPLVNAFKLKSMWQRGKASFLGKRYNKSIGNKNIHL